MTQSEHGNPTVCLLDVDNGSQIATITLRMEGRANKIDASFGEGLSSAFEAAINTDGIKGIIITSGHKDFCVGADIEMLYGLDSASARSPWEC